MHKYTAFQWSIFKSTAELYFRFLPEKEKSQCGETQTISLLANSFLSEACSVAYFFDYVRFHQRQFYTSVSQCYQALSGQINFLILIGIEMNIISSRFS